MKNVARLKYVARRFSGALHCPADLDVDPVVWLRSFHAVF